MKAYAQQEALAPTQTYSGGVEDFLILIVITVVVFAAVITLKRFK